MRPSLLLAALAASLVALTGTASAQPCAPAGATSALENAGVRAQLFNNGALFWRDRDSPRAYEVPTGSGVHSFFHANLWVGGTTDGALRFAGTGYGPYEYWPGPLAEDGTTDASTCAAYDRIWRVTLEDVARYNTTGVASADLAEWPYEAGAPVVDGNGDPDDYDLAAGDRPAILGDETAWWVMNDRGDTHDWSELPAIGVEVRVTAFTISEAYASRLVFSREDARLLHHATAYRYEITYRGEVPLANAYIGLFSNTDLGHSEDDYVGSAPDQNMGYTYNGDRLDGWPFPDGTPDYGSLPPALGVRILGGPAERPLAHFVDRPFRPSAIQPVGGPEAYQYMQGLWRDGSPITYGGAGYQTGEETDYMFPVTPPEFWSEMNIDGQGTANVPGDRSFVVSHGPFTLAPEETATITFVVPWVRSDRGHLGSVRELLTRASPLVAAVVRDLEPDPELATITLHQLPVPIPVEPDPPELPASDAVAASVWPNPTTGDAVLRLDLSGPARVRLVLHDALGRQLAVPVDETLGAAEHELPIATDDLPPGVYLYRLAVAPEGQGPLETTGRFVVAR